MVFCYPLLFKRIIPFHRFFIGFLVLDDEVSGNNYFMPDGYQCFFFALSGSKPVILGFKATALLASGPPTTLSKGALQVSVAMERAYRFFFPPLSLFPGLMPAQLLRCFSLGKRPISVPTSLIMPIALSLPTPGMPCNKSTSTS